MPTTATKERPVLFSGPMVRAILSGQKTQTRRIVKPQPVPLPEDAWRPSPPQTRDDHWWSCSQAQMMIDIRDMAGFCPMGVKGDRLYVRETWASAMNNPVLEEAVVYRATDPDWSEVEGFRWRPSIHMPRWASRITLEITSVRVERLQDISNEDAIAEGVERLTPPGEAAFFRNYIPDVIPSFMLPSRSFMSLWESINGPGSWAANPWVWVIEFKRLGAE